MVIDIKLFPCSNSGKLFPQLLRIANDKPPDPQPSIAPDTVANHALWSFGDAQSSVDPAVCSGKIKMSRMEAYHRRTFGGEHPVLWKRHFRDKSTLPQK